MKLTESLAKS